jgi:hypothetical protein
VLAFAPAEVGGIWPPTGVRALVEREASDDLEIRFIMGARSQRDVFTKALTDGGAQERGLAAHYREYADAMAVPAPRTAAMLRRIVDQYESDAYREDIRAKQRDVG